MENDTKIKLTWCVEINQKSLGHQVEKVLLKKEQASNSEQILECSNFAVIGDFGKRNLCEVLSKCGFKTECLKKT
jgi:hypothetical protein